MGAAGWATLPAGIQLTNTAAADLGVADVGTSTEAARGDHVHKLPVAGEIVVTPAGNLAATNVQAALEELDTGLTAAGTASAAAATAAQTAAEATAAAALAAHEGAGDPHAGYQLESEKSAANGYASLDASVKVPFAELPTGTGSAQVAIGDHTHANYIPTSEKGANGGVAELDAAGLIASAHIPPLTVTDVHVVADEGAMLALSPQAHRGDFAVRSDLSATFVLTNDDGSNVGDWQQIITPAGGGGTVTSVNGDPGPNVAINAGDIPFTAGGGVASTDVQAALAELDIDKAAVGNTVGAALAAAGAAGTATEAARADHVHPLPSAADVGADAAGAAAAAQAAAIAAAATDATTKAAAAQTAAAAALTAHTTGHIAAGTAAPLVAGTAAAGTAADVSHEDHVHPAQNAAGTAFTPAGGIAATNVQTALVELDTEKAGLGTAAPLAAGTAAVGTSTLAARQDHVHPRELPAPTTAGRVLTVNAAGTGVEWAAGGGPTVTTDATAGNTPTSNPPATPKSGDVFINTADGLTWVYDGATWQAVVGGGFSESFTYVAGTAHDVAHNLNKAFPQVSVWNETTKRMVTADVVSKDANTITVIVNVAGDHTVVVG